MLDYVAHGRNKLIGDSGSAEGLLEAYMATPNGVLVISELQNWLDARHWKHKAVDFLTFAFNKGHFSQRLSSRTGSNVVRKSNYCYPNILANVQPDVFARTANETDVENGFLGRFLYVCAPDFDCEPGVFDIEDVADKIGQLLGAFESKEGVIDVPLCYAKDIKDEFKVDTASNLLSFSKRLSNEYYPRLAAILSITTNDDPRTKELVITDEGWERARKLVYWFYRNARMLLTRVEDIDPKTRRFETVVRKVLEKMLFLQKRGGIVTKARISKSGIRNTSSEERTKAIEELVSRGWATFSLEEGFKVVHIPQEWQTSGTTLTPKASKFDKV